jgi:Uma2 family endonuclease
MAAVHSNLPYTVEEYLALERESEERHEFVDGFIYAMAGESPEHNIICVNLTGELRAQLKGTPCQALSKDMKVLSGPDPLPRKSKKGLFSYPDVIVVCGELKFHDRHRDVLVNPTVIIEVLSDTTEAFDRGDKFLRYQTWNPTLTDYILVSQRGTLIEHFIRRSGGEWTYSVHQTAGEDVWIESINCRLKLPEIYERIVFRIKGDETVSSAI